MRIVKAANKAKLEAIRRIDMGGDGDPELARQLTIQAEFKKLDEAAELGMEVFMKLKDKLSKSTNPSIRTYMITIRPKHDTNFLTFKKDVESFVDRWKNKWDYYMYAFEQKGTSLDTLGYGFHVHIVIDTMSKSCFPSHILRGALTIFGNYTAANCIQVDTIKNRSKALEYIQGIKEQNKMSCVEFDKIWRTQCRLESSYQSGQVQPL